MNAAQQGPNREDNRINLGLIYGGRSAEREVSNLSAQAVFKHLDPERYRIFPIVVSSSGKWTILPAGNDLPTLGREEEILATSSIRSRARLPIPGSSPDGAAANSEESEELRTLDVVFPLIHGTYGEDGSLQGFLDLCGIPYVGAGVAGSALGMDKALMKDVLNVHGVPCVAYISVRRCDWERHPAGQQKRIEAEIGYPCFVKPARTGSSVGISKVHHEDELDEAMNLACRYDSVVVIEKALSVRELECGVIGNEDPKVTVVGEVIPDSEFYDYRAKYLTDGTQILIPANIDDATAEKVREIARKTYCVLRCSGFARVDMFLERTTGEVYLNEINTIPGFTSHSMFPMLWDASGLPFTELLNQLIDYALDRHRDENRNEITVPVHGLLPQDD